MRGIGALLLVGCLGLGACGRRESSESQTQASSTAGAEVGQPVAEAQLPACCNECPLALRGVDLKFAPSTGGGSMMFTAPDTELEELRQRVRRLAEYHNDNQRRLAMMTLPHQAEVTDIEGGAQLTLTTHVGNDVPQLQTEVEQELHWMSGGRCPASADKDGCVCQLGWKPPLASSPESESEQTPRPQVGSTAQEP
jgi:hypothetical protein